MSYHIDDNIHGVFFLPVWLSSWSDAILEIEIVSFLYEDQTCSTLLCSQSLVRLPARKINVQLSHIINWDLQIYTKKQNLLNDHKYCNELKG